MTKQADISIESGRGLIYMAPPYLPYLYMVYGPVNSL